MEIDW